MKHSPGGLKDFALVELGRAKRGLKLCLFLENPVKIRLLDIFDLIIPILPGSRDPDIFLTGIMAQSQSYCLLDHFEI